MSNLFASLYATSRALEAQRYGLDVVGQNIANVNTPGYVRRVIDLQAVPPPSPNEADGGVEVAGVRALRAGYLESRLAQELPAQQREAALAETLDLAQTAIGAPGASLDATLSAFFDSFSRLAEDPSSSTARQEVLIQGSNLASVLQRSVGPSRLGHGATPTAEFATRWDRSTPPPTTWRG